MKFSFALVAVTLSFFSTHPSSLPSQPEAPPSSQDSISPEQALFDTLFLLDSILFDAAFNTCDMDVIADLMTEDLEFYHDKGGLVANSRDQFIENLSRGCQRKAEGTDIVAKRVLDKASLNVYPMNNYGAIQTGVHRFYEVREGEEDLLREEALFTHLWQYQNGEWRISRVLSYDHQWKGE